MRFSRDKIHPSLANSIDRLRTTMTWGGQARSKAEVDAYTHYQNLWFRKHGVTFFGTILLFFVGIGCAAALKPIYGKPAVLFAMLGVLALCGLVIAVATKLNRRSFDVDELAMILPALQLTPIQRAYAEGLLALSGMQLPSDTERELMNQFHALLDEEARLLKIRERGAVEMATPVSVAAERDELAAKLEVSTDPVTREALERSIEICEGRMNAARELSLVVQRVDAQLEMLAQSIRGLRDTLQRLHSAPMEAGSAINLSPVRHTIQHAQQHATALEAAVNEVQSLTL